MNQITSTSIELNDTTIRGSVHHDTEAGNYKACVHVNGKPESISSLPNEADAMDEMRDLIEEQKMWATAETEILEWDQF